MSEGRVQNEIRIAAPRDNVLLFRNNVGVLLDRTGRPVRFGLANDSKGMNERFKSSDLIGLNAHGRFLAIEVKEPGHRTDAGRLAAQEAFIELIRAWGGLAGFADSVEAAREIWNA